jgi:hypothetical protein
MSLLARDSHHPSTALRGHIASALAAVAAFSLALICGARVAHAGTQVVTNPNDSGVGSLRQAVLNAAPGDTIVFSPTVFNTPLTITLSAQIQVSKSLTIDGAAGGVVTPTISGNGLTRTFTVNTGNVTLNRLRLVNAVCAHCIGGGAIYNAAVLSVTHSVLFNNAVITTTVQGGAGIFNASGARLYVSDSTFDANSAPAAYGAALYNDITATLVVTGSAFTNNSVGTQLGAYGGAIYNEGALTLTNSTFSGNGNATSSEGGGLYNAAAGVAALTNVTFSANTAYVGAGVRNVGLMSLTNITASGNNGSYGGGVANRGTLSIDNSRLLSNSASGPANCCYGGAGLYNSGVMTVTRSLIAGNNAQIGGGISNNGMLALISSTLSNNSASLYGGALGNDTVPYGPVVTIITDSTFLSNTAGTSGGAIDNIYALWLFNTSFDGNTAGSWGGAILHSAMNIGGYITCYSMNATNVTFARNSAAQGNSLSVRCPVTLIRTIVSSASSGTNCDVTTTPITDGGYNLDSSNSCGFSSTLHSLVNSDPRLGVASDNGGPAFTIPLLLSSPAIDAGGDGCSSRDARGVLRPYGAHCDIGAYELTVAIRRSYLPLARVGVVPLTPITVTNTNDSGPGSLRQAVLDTSLGGGLIRFSPSVFAIPQTITLSSGEIVINKALIIDGATGGVAAPSLTSAPFPNNSRIFNIDAAGVVSLIRLRIMDVHSANDGLGVYNLGALTVQSTTIAGNYVQQHDGAGIWNGGTLTLTASTLSGNGAWYGGGLYNQGNALIINTTFSGNQALVASGGAIHNSGNLRIVNSTLSNNDYFSRNSVQNNGVMTWTNTLVASSTCAGVGTSTDNGHNLDSANTCGFTAPTSLLNTNPLLGALADNGGPVMTLALLPGSPARNAGDDALCPATDARGVARPFGAHCDIGAYEAP